MNQATVKETNEDAHTDTFKILDPSNNIEIIITAVHTISLQSILHLIPTQTSLESHQSLLSDLSNDKSNNSSIVPILHIFKSSKGRLRHNGYWLCKLKFKIDDKFNHWGVVFPILKGGGRMVDGSYINEGGDGEYFGVFKVNEPVHEDNMADKIYRISNEEDLVNVSQQSREDEDEESLTTAMNEEIELFSMKPPSNQKKHDGTLSNTGSNFTSPLKHEESQDPLYFITNRYYHSLYSLNEPLSYFPKTSLTRFKNLCQGDVSLTLTILDSLVLGMDKFDLRYDGKSHGQFCAGSVGTLSDCEVWHQEKFKERFGFIVKGGNNGSKKAQLPSSSSNGIDHDKFQKLLLELKIREAQLQIIILFEIFQIWNIDEKAFLKRNLQKSNEVLKRGQDHQKVSLVRVRKKRKLDNNNKDKKKTKRVKPTTISGPDTSNDLDRELSHYLYLNRLIDRLNLWEILSVPEKQDKLDGQSTNIGGSSLSYGFLAYVLVPYYGKILPLLIKYVIENTKNTNMKLTSSHKSLKTKSKRKKKERLEESSIDKQTVGNNDKNDEGRSTEKKRSKVERKPLLKGDDENHLIKDISVASLKRSKSSLGGQASREMLDKRQVDLNFKPPHLKKQISSNLENGGGTLATSSSSLIFGQAKRSKSLAGGEGPAKLRSGMTSQVHVAETPMKPGRDALPSGVAATGSNGGRNLLRSFSQVEATPAKQRVIDMEIFTPVSKQPRSNENSVQQSQVTSSIFTSPANDDAASSPFLKPASSSMTQRLQSVASGIASVAASAASSPRNDTTLVQATPRKPQSDDLPSLSVESPHDLIVEATPQRKTPQSQKRLDASVIEATPVQNIAKLQALSSKLPDIQATPIQQQRSHQSPFMKQNHEGEFKSPINFQKSGNFSSPSVHKTKPGDPIAISESPIFNAYTSTGLLSLRGKAGEEEENEEDRDAAYDSDEILNPKKKKARLTYSRR
ncbi:hypothetical protein I9W82_001435 [Candida metapsilosis]|uniref:DNA replication regulator Sld3 C-terminal domain-containing protein n=1 Tax=Candida metapsilosis TaxID=273372 RepID=A0A8H7ZL69_9ASCO|nr:hypothetical protein I9W82_001435 [Candida metapsilosis]